MENIYVYCVQMPRGVHEFVTPCSDGFTVYLDEKLDKQHRIRAFKHALKHVECNDFEKEVVQEIEHKAHCS